MKNFVNYDLRKNMQGLRILEKFLNFLNKATHTILADFCINDVKYF